MILVLWPRRTAMPAQEAHHRTRKNGRLARGSAWTRTLADRPRLPDGSIDYELFKRRARQLRGAMLATIVAAVRQGLVHALQAAAAAIRPSASGRPSQARR